MLMEGTQKSRAEREKQTENARTLCLINQDLMDAMEGLSKKGRGGFICLKPMLARNRY